MGSEMMGIDELAVYLQRDAREVRKMASRGYLPGQKISGEWRFHQVEINHWIENQMHAYTEQELTRIDSAKFTDNMPGQIMVSAMMSLDTIATPMQARTKKSVLKELVQLAEQSWEVYDPETIQSAILQREEMNSTALPSGIAIPHPHRPLAKALGADVVSFGRTASPIPFGSNHGGLTDLFFLVLCRDHRTHLTVLARLSRMFLRADFLTDLHKAESSREVLSLIETTENELI